MADPRIRPTGQNLSQAARPQMNNFGVTRPASQLQTGDVVQGEITDLHNNEITITTGDNTVIRGQITDGSMLSIGQTAAFRLSSVSGNVPVLEAIPNSYTDTERTIINKALQEAGLPSTERNQAAVKALMDNLLPINKQSIMHLMQQAYDYSTEDMDTLAIMNKNHMEITPDTVTQFSNYRNQQYQLLSKVEIFSQEIPELLDTLAKNGPASAVADFGERLLTITLSDGRSSSPAPSLMSLNAKQQEEIRSMLSESPLSDKQLQSLSDGTMSLREALSLIRDAASDGTLLLSENVSSHTLTAKMQEIQMVLEPAIPSEEQGLATGFHAMTAETAENETTVSPLSENPEETHSTNQENISAQTEESGDSVENPSSRFAFAGKFLQNLSEAARSSIQSFNQMLATGTSGAQMPQVLDSMITSLANSQYERDSLTFLSPQDRLSLLQELEGFPVSQSLKDSILSGEATSHEVLTVIRNLIPLADSKQSQQLFQSEPFQSLFTHTLLSSLTITPKELDAGNLNQFYRHMEQKMDSFEHLISSTLSGNDSSQLSGEAHDIKSNIDFLKLLNENFAYMQLPLKLQNQNAHGDLYVYTNKNQRKQNPEKLSVLLHLDMEHLGPIDIRLEKDHTAIDASFHLSDQPSLQLIQNNTSLLENVLEEKGYQCSIHVASEEKTMDIVNDFLNTKVTTNTTHEMKRFSFDIRA